MNECPTRGRLPPLFKRKPQVLKSHAVDIQAFAIRSVYRDELRRKVQNLPKLCALAVDTDRNHDSASGRQRARLGPVDDELALGEVPALLDLGERVEVAERGDHDLAAA